MWSNVRGGGAGQKSLIVKVTSEKMSKKNLFMFRYIYTHVCYTQYVFLYNIYNM